MSTEKAASSAEGSAEEIAGYITTSGSRVHLDRDCRQLTQVDADPEPITKDRKQRLGYTLCSICGGWHN